MRVLLTRNLLLRGKDRFDTAQVDVDHARVRPLLDHAGHDVALATAELPENGVVGDVAQALIDDLLRRERSNAPEVTRAVLRLADDISFVIELGNEDGHMTGLAIEVDTRCGRLIRVAVMVVGLIGVLQVGGQDRLFDDRHQLVEGDLSFAFHETQDAEVDVHAGLLYSDSCRREPRDGLSYLRYPIASLPVTLDNPSFERTVSGMTTEVKGAARAAEDNPAIQVLARVGNVAVGVVHILIGGIAISLAFGTGGEADQSGAFNTLMQSPGGVIVVWIVVIGLLALGLWEVVETILARGADPKRRWAKRLKEAGKAVVYFALAGVGIAIALGGSSNSAASTSSTSAKILSSPGGVLLLILIGLLIFALGVGYVVRGARKSFARDIQTPPGPAGDATITLGVIGYVAKGIALGIVGVLFVVAAVTHDSSKANGLDGALLTLRGLPFGPVILFVVALGLIAYGVYYCVRAFVVRL